MKTIGSLGLLCLLTLPLSGCIIVLTDDSDDCGYDGMCESPDIVSEHEISEFSSVQVTGSASIQVEICDCDPSVELTNDAEFSSINSSGGRVTVTGSGSGWWGKPAFYLKTRSLSEVSVTGSGTIRVKRMKGKSLSVQLTGSGDVKLHGEVESLNVTKTGSGEVEAHKLRAQSVNVTSSGSGDMTVCVEDTLSGLSTGSGDIEVHCEPKRISVQSSGSGSIETH